MLRKTTLPLLVPVLLVLVLASCANKAQQGAVLGGLAGAAIGGQVGPSSQRGKNALIGGLIGVAAGYIIGNEWDKYDARKLDRTLETQPSGQTTAWTNPDTGKNYAATPHPAYEQNDKIYRNVTIQTPDGDKVNAQAYRDAQGNWHLVQ